MNLTDFQQLPLHQQSGVLYRNGIYVGKRKRLQQTTLLYQLEGFYVEIMYARYRKQIMGIRSSASTHLLDPYLEQINMEDFVG